MTEKKRWAPIRAGLSEDKHRKAMGLSVFTYTYLVAYANTDTGKLTIKQTTLANEMGVSRATVNRDIARLKEYGYIEIVRHTHTLDIQVANWRSVRERHEGIKEGLDDAVSDVTTLQHHNGSDVTYVEHHDVTSLSTDSIRPQIVLKDNNINNNINTPISYGNGEVNELLSYFKEKLDLVALDGSIQQNRRYAWLLLKKVKSLAAARLLVDLAEADEFYRNNTTSFRSLYYNAVKIYNRRKAAKSGGKVAVYRRPDEPADQ